MKKSGRIIVIFSLFFVFLVLIFEAQLIFNFPLWALLIFAFSLGMFFSFWLIPHRVMFSNIEAEDWLYVFVSALIMAEMVFILSFWPFNCFTTSAILLAVYYALWDFWSYKKKNKLTLGKIGIDLLIVIIAVIVLLGTTKWLP